MKYDELVKSLRHCSANPQLLCINCPSYDRGKSATCLCATENMGKAADAIEELSKPGWIKFKTRPLTEEERKDYPAWDDVLDCKLPDDGKKILVYVKRRGTEFIEVDQFCDDSDGTYLSSGYALVEEATHWMPLPEPPEEDE